MQMNEYGDWTDSTAIYPEAGAGTFAALNYCILAMGGEVGEILNKWKKIIRDQDGVITDLQCAEMLSECGDTLYYLTRVTKELGFSLATCAAHNRFKLEGRKEAGTLGGTGDNR